MKTTLGTFLAILAFYFQLLYFQLMPMLPHTVCPWLGKPMILKRYFR